MLRRSTKLTSLHVRDALTINEVHTAISTASAVTYTAAQINTGWIDRDCNGAGRADLMPTAAQLYTQFGSPEVNTTFQFIIKNTSGAANSVTLTTNTGITLTGTMTVAQNNLKIFHMTFTSPTAVTVYSLGTLVF